METVTTTKKARRAGKPRATPDVQLIILLAGVHMEKDIGHFASSKASGSKAKLTSQQPQNSYKYV